MERKLHITMFGEFSLQVGDAKISCMDNRSRKAWLLLAYLVFNRQRLISQPELMSMLWPDEAKLSDPKNALKALVFRIRSILDGLYPSAGHELLIWQNGCYALSPEVHAELDIDAFDALCGKEAGDEDALLKSRMQALALYNGDFLSLFSHESWVLPISVYYHNIFLRTVNEVVCVLERRSRFDDCISLCQKALEVEPYNEALCAHLMKVLIAVGNKKRAARLYMQLYEELLSNFGILPSEELRELYHAAAQEDRSWLISPEVLREELQKPGNHGAMNCDYDFFRLLYQANARLLSRTGEVFHVVLLTLDGKAGDSVSKRSLERAASNLKALATSRLRRGDVVSSRSLSQIVLMLPQANFENSCKVCERIVKQFRQKYPHSPVEVRYSIQPIEPLEITENKFGHSKESAWT